VREWLFDKQRVLVTGLAQELPALPPDGSMFVVKSVPRGTLCWNGGWKRGQLVCIQWRL